MASVVMGGRVALRPVGSPIMPVMSPQDRKLPLDFFSYHWYGSDPAGPAATAVAARKILDEFGFQRTEIHLNEWHYLNVGWNELRPTTREGFRVLRAKFQGTYGAEAAAFAMAVLIQLQDTPLDVANYFCAGADTLHWSMFDEYGVPSPTYYAFRALDRKSTRLNSSHLGISY